MNEREKKTYEKFIKFTQTGLSMIVEYQDCFYHFIFCLIFIFYWGRMDDDVDVRERGITFRHE